MRTRESEEMYLETIFLLKRKKTAVRSVDIVEELDYAKSSVSRGVNLLVKKGYITHDHATGDIEFTQTGRLKAEIYTKGTAFLQLLLKKLGQTGIGRKKMPAALNTSFPKNCSI